MSEEVFYKDFGATSKRQTYGLFLLCSRTGIERFKYFFS
jgi:hypothetical protein